jgi:hypothetical protein
MRVLERLPVRLALAILSGVAIGFTGDVPGSGWLHEYGLPGALFAAGVFWPHLRAGNLVVARAVALVTVSGVSYWAAIGTALEVAPALGLNDASEPNLPAFVLASLVGAGIVVVPAKWLIPLRTPAQYWVLATVAALVGGVVMYVGLVSDLSSDPLNFAAFATWHALLCVALHFGSRAGAR